MTGINLSQVSAHIIPLDEHGAVLPHSKALLESHSILFILHTESLVFATLSPPVANTIDSKGETDPFQESSSETYPVGVVRDIEGVKLILTAPLCMKHKGTVCHEITLQKLFKISNLPPQPTLHPA